MLQFDWIWVLWLLPLPLMSYFLLPQKPVASDAALRVPFLHELTDQQQLINTGKSKIWITILKSLAWICLILATARPQWLGDQIEIPINGRDLMLAVDLSGSMEEVDFELNGQRVTRLQATKAVASQFIEQRQGDRLGLILFGSQAYLQTPLTFDRATVITLLQESAIGLAGKKTAIGDAIGLAIKRLQNQSSESRVLILLTDGANTAGEVSPLKAADLAADKQLKIYTIGIGADEMIKKSFWGSRKINPSLDLDETTLTAIATKTGGRYFRAKDTKELVEIYQLLDELEKIEKDRKSFRPVTALFYWPLGLALLVVAVLSLWTLQGRVKK